MDPKVSVIIGTFNRQSLLIRCLNSVLKQNYGNFEVIVINDNSSDNTVQVLEDFRTKYPSKFYYISNKRNLGIAQNSNIAFNSSSGEYIALIGDDDEWIATDKLEIQVNHMQKNKKLGLISTWWQDIENNKIVKIHSPNIDKNPLKQILVHNGIYCGSTALIRRSAWEKVGGFDTRLPRGTDSDLFRSIIYEDFESYIIPEITTNVYIDGNDRMTPQDSIIALEKHIIGNRICIKKFKRSFNKYPIIRFQKMYKIYKSYFKIFKMKALGKKL